MSKNPANAKPKRVEYGRYAKMAAGGYEIVIDAPPTQPRPPKKATAPKARRPKPPTASGQKTRPTKVQA